MRQVSNVVRRIAMERRFQIPCVLSCITGVYDVCVQRSPSVDGTLLKERVALHRVSVFLRLQFDNLICKKETCAIVGEPRFSPFSLSFHPQEKNAVRRRLPFLLLRESVVAGSRTSSRCACKFGRKKNGKERTDVKLLTYSGPWQQTDQ